MELYGAWQRRRSKKDSAKAKDESAIEKPTITQADVLVLNNERKARDSFTRPEAASARVRTLSFHDTYTALRSKSDWSVQISTRDKHTRVSRWKPCAVNSYSFVLTILQATDT